MSNATQSTPAFGSPRRGVWRRWGRRRFRQRRVQLATLLLLNVLVALIVGYRWMTSSAHLRHVVARALQTEVGGQVEVGAVRFALTGPIEIDNLRITLADRSRKDAAVLTLGHAAITHNPWSLLRGRVSPRVITLDQVTLFVTQNHDLEHLNLQDLLAQRLPRRPAAPLAVPEIHLQNARIVFGAVTQGLYQAVGLMPLTGELVPQNIAAVAATAPAPGSPGDQRFQFSLRETLPFPTASAPHDLAPPSPTHALDIHGWFDPARGTFTAEVENLPFEKLPPECLPTEVRAWWEKMDPRGSFPHLAVGLDANKKLWARLAVRDLRMNVPLQEKMAPLSARAADLYWHDQTLTVERLDGVFADCTYHLAGDIGNVGADPTLQLRLVLGGPIPHDPELLALLPPVTRHYIQRFDARGDFHADFTLAHTGPGQPYNTSGVLEIAHARLCDEHNPYPIEHAKGRIRFDPAAVNIDFIDGAGPSGAAIHAQGLIAPPTDDGGVDVTVTMKNVPMDQYLLDSLAPDERKIVAQLVSHPALERLYQQGVVTDPNSTTTTAPTGAAPVPAASASPAISVVTPAASTTAAAPAFALDGAINLGIVTHCDPGPHPHWSTITTIDLAGARMLGEFWPYPMRVDQGELVVNGRSVQVKDVHLSGLSGATATLTGSLTPDPAAPGKTITDLHVAATRVPLDNLLWSSLPAQEQSLLRSLSLTGAMNAQADITSNAQHDIVFRIRPHLENVRAQPLGSSLVLQDIAAQLELTPGAAEVTSLTARQDQAQLTLSGRMDFRPAQPCAFTWQARVRDMHWESGLLDLLQHVEGINQFAAVAQWTAMQPAGAFDADVSLARSGDHGAALDDYAIDMRPHELSLTRQGQRIELQNMTGALHAQAGTVQVHNLTGQWPLGGMLAVDGRLTPGSTLGLDITVQAQADAWTPAMNALLPQDVAQALADMEFQGGYELRDTHLVITPTSQGSSLAFDSQLHLHHAGAVLGVPVSDYEGVLSVQVRQSPDQPQAQLSLRAHADQVRLVDRLVSPLSFQLASVAVPTASAATSPAAPAEASVDMNTPHGAWQLQQMEGDCYGGKLLVTGWILPGKPGWYNLNLVLSNAALEPITHPQNDAAWMAATQAASAAGPADTTPTGRLSANLSLEGSPADAATRHGRGQLEISNARLYEVPMTMAMLQIINLSWPGSSSFDSVSARYIVDGPTVRLEVLSFDAPNLRIAGGGVMQLPDMTLDLDMFTRTPGRDNWGPMGEAIDVIKDGLISLRVTGTLADPKAQLQSFAGVRRTWNDLFSAPPKSSSHGNATP